jgi:hypothetical protein
MHRIKKLVKKLSDRLKKPAPQHQLVPAATSPRKPVEVLEIPEDDDDGYGGSAYR